MPLEIALHSVNDLTFEQQEEVKRWFHEEFGHVPYQWAMPVWYVLARINVNLVGCLGIIERIVLVDGQPLRVGGVSGVITHPDWRKQGIAKTVLEYAATWMNHHLGVQFGLLLCRKEVAAVYAKLGWKLVEGPTIFEQPNGKVTYPKLTMVLPYTQQTWPEGTIDLCGLPW